MHRIKNKTRFKNKLKISFLSIFSIIISIILLKYAIVDIQQLKQLGSEFQYNIISMSATIGGFLFTGVSILISVIDKDRIKRLWDNNYLDNLYHSAFIGMFANIFTIACAFVVICCNIEDCVIDYFYYIEVSTTIIGLVFFGWCIKHLLFIITRLKNTSTNNT